MKNDILSDKIQSYVGRNDVPKHALDETGLWCFKGGVDTQEYAGFLLGTRYEIADVFEGKFEDAIAYGFELKRFFGDYASKNDIGSHMHGYVEKTPLWRIQKTFEKT